MRRSTVAQDRAAVPQQYQVSMAKAAAQQLACAKLALQKTGQQCGSSHVPSQHGSKTEHRAPARQQAVESVSSNSKSENSSSISADRTPPLPG